MLDFKNFKKNLSQHIDALTSSKMRPVRLLVTSLYDRWIGHCFEFSRNFLLNNISRSHSHSLLLSREMGVLVIVDSSSLLSHIALNLLLPPQ